MKLFKCQNCARYTTESDYCHHCHHDGQNDLCDVPKKVFVLTCGCCGSYYDSFNKDSEFDHDLGYGECPKCHDWILAKNEKEFDKIFAIIEGGLSPKNLEKWYAFSRDRKKDVAIKLLDSGVLKFSIRPTII